ncbi:EscU/YscU/HrcU family type III secretion system export apparatus switch protein [Calditerrivibrio nitroreducens]|uniref:Type III secretion exporter n=1 Tax=Calditerrivibrio nitroreducens (strain DSM 19672 / NBRC 101217 / Yu37-1) TaxID=768670 RepID=E4TF09_CALNY|nr:EscU/YscU/HrcU family type III secretion system export apparatus switch protein [Calditerrivibrio nitroreducens]ADR19449.1 type III secretion exporter [Calditerrivibrio nitroreducens DSM 19672]
MGKAKKVTALRYDQEKDSAPKVVAKGRGIIAEKILEKAKEHNVLIKEDPDLLEALYKLDIYQEIPENLYRVVAEILSEVYRINKKLS